MADLRDSPSFKYFIWGFLNALFLGISILHKVDISETGIAKMILDVFKSLYESVGLPSGWITTIGIFLVVISLASLIIEILTIWSKGWIPRIIAFLGFSSLLLILFGVESIGIILLILGALMVALYPNE